MRSIRRKRKFGFKIFEVEGMKVYSYNIPIGAVPKRIYNFFLIRYAKRLFKKASKDYGMPDALLTMFTEQGYAASKIRQEFNVPAILIEPNSIINKKEIDDYFYNLAYKTYHNLDRVIAVSPAFRDHLNEKFNIKSIYNPVLPSLELFFYKERENSEIFKIVSTGRISKLKGFRELILAFSEAFKDKKASLEIFGGGPDEAYLKDLIAKENMGDKIFLRGMQNRETIAKAYESSDLFVLLSHSETFGLVYLEALASGLPIIATRCSGPEHLVTDENGILVDLFDHDKTVEALNYMYENYKKYDKRKISEDTKNNFSKKKITDDLVEIMKEAVKDYA